MIHTRYTHNTSLTAQIYYLLKCFRRLCTDSSTLTLMVIIVLKKSDKLKKALRIELACLWEERLTTWHFQKHSHYRKLESTEKANGRMWFLCLWQ